jgi:hypothetical protein
MSQEKEDRMTYLEMALKAAKEMDEQASRPRYAGTRIATKATNAIKARSVPEMPEGVRLLEWNPKPAPVLLTTASLVTDVDQFIADTLAQLDRALRSKQGVAAYRKVRELVDRLEQCGIIVQIRGVGSASGGRQ